jgi:hypothetical protein
MSNLASGMQVVAGATDNHSGRVDTRLLDKMNHLSEALLDILW